MQQYVRGHNRPSAKAGGQFRKREHESVRRIA